MGVLDECGEHFCGRRQTSAAPPKARHTPAMQDVSDQSQGFGPLGSRWCMLHAAAA